MNHEHKKEHLLLLEPLRVFYNTFIYEWWNLINATEPIKTELSGPASLDKLFSLIEERKEEFKTIYAAISE